ncbi:MAG: MGMT family protein [Candidatus Izemoplasmatales bacterium]
MTEFTEKVIEIIGQIPQGKVLTYGRVAVMADNPWGARQVVRILNSMSEKYHLPWHRVINSKGEVSLTGATGELQKKLLKEDGVEISDGKIDLDKYLYRLL